MRNRTMIQFFEWYLPDDCTLWRKATDEATALAKLGITEIWLPPAYKAAGGRGDVGYGVYDMYDLGEFDQKGSVATKYGTKDEYLSAIKALQRAGVRVYADVVFNHRMGADETEMVHAKIYNNKNRSVLEGERDISAWTKFTFPQRNGKYSDFVWSAKHFDGCDWDDLTGKQALYLFCGKNWDDQVDIENGNYDYLMGADLDLHDVETYNELISWGKWYLDITGVNGFRLDAVKHINFPKIMDWFWQMRNYSGRELFAVGEYWNNSLPTLIYYLNKTAHTMHLFDVPLHYNLHKASSSHGGFDMRRILDGTLVKERPNRAVTIVDNHDTQPGQALESWVGGWFKLHAYSLILLRESGIPCVFYGDLYGIPHDNISAVGDSLCTMLRVRYDLAYGEQLDYFDNENIIGFTRMGEDEYIYSGLAVVMTDSTGGALHMCMGEKFIGCTMVDCMGNISDKIVVGGDGCATFPVHSGSVSVYVDERYMRDKK